MQQSGSFAAAGQASFGFRVLALLVQDKVGPFARSAADAAVVLDAIRGRDPADPSSFTADLQDPFSINVQSLTVGVLSNTPTLVSLNFKVLASAF